MKVDSVGKVSCVARCAGGTGCSQTLSAGECTECSKLDSVPIL